jgi:hypothetical protein
MAGKGIFTGSMASRLIGAILLVACAAPVAWADSAPASSLPAHVVNGTNGKVQPEAGYRWVSNDPNDLRVEWAPGTPSPTAPNVVAATTEGQWTPAPGYKWANDTPGDLTVARADAPAAAPAVDGAAVLRAIAKIGISQAVLAKARNDDDGSIGDAVGIQLMVAVRDAAVLSAMHDVLPDESDADCSAAQIVLCLCMDGQLTAANWATAEGKDLIMRKLRESDPDVANSAEVVDFIAQVAAHYNDQHPNQ